MPTHSHHLYHLQPVKLYREPGPAFQLLTGVLGLLGASCLAPLAVQVHSTGCSQAAGAISGASAPQQGLHLGEFWHWSGRSASQGACWDGLSAHPLPPPVSLAACEAVQRARACFPADMVLAAVASAGLSAWCMQAPLLAYNHFVEALFILNDCREGLHGGGSAAAMADVGDAFSHSHLGGGHQLRGSCPQLRAKRDTIYRWGGGVHSRRCACWACSACWHAALSILDLFAGREHPRLSPRHAITSLLLRAMLKTAATEIAAAVLPELEALLLCMKVLCCTEGCCRLCRALLSRMAPEHKFATAAKLCSEVLGGMADGALPLSACEEVLGDALRCLACREIKVRSPRSVLVSCSG